MRKHIRSLLQYLHLDVTKNLRYDRYTKAIMKRIIKPTDNCIDVGAHRGELLDQMMRLAPRGQHFAFEPLPHLYQNLVRKYGDRIKIYQDALSDHQSLDSFHHVVNDPAYSGLRKRKYDHPNPEILKIDVQTNTLDYLIYPLAKIDFIKIDVEGAEMLVLKGGRKLIKRDKPSILFEFGTGASEFYGTSPNELFGFLTTELAMDIYTLCGWLKNCKPLTNGQLNTHFQKGSEYYFLAASNN